MVVSRLSTSDLLSPPFGQSRSDKSIFCLHGANVNNTHVNNTELIMERGDFCLTDVVRLKLAATDETMPTSTSSITKDSMAYFITLLGKLHMTARVTWKIVIWSTELMNVLFIRALNVRNSEGLQVKHRDSIYSSGCVCLILMVALEN